MLKKITCKALSVFALTACLFLAADKADAQVSILFEDFESVTAPALPAMWTSTNPNGGDLFITGDSAAANAGTYWPIEANGQFALANDDVCNCDMSEVRLILPPLDLTSFTSTTISAEVWSDQFYTMEENSIEVSIDNGVTWTTVGSNFPVATAWQPISYDLSAFDGVSNVWIAFRHNDVGGWGQGLAVNDVLVEGIPTGPTCFFYEDFESVTAPALPAMWVSTNPNGGDLFITGDAADANAGTYWPVDANGQFAFANDDVCNCDMSEVRLILPPQDFSTKADVMISAEVWSDQVYTLEENSLEVSLDNGATWTQVGANFPVATAWQPISYDLSAYDGLSNVWIAFRHNDVGGWGQGLAVNDVCLEGTDVFSFCEDFEGVTAPALPPMWTSTNPNGGDLFITGDSAAANAGTYWPIEANGQFAIANDDLCNCDMSEVRLILPPLDFTGFTGMSISAEVWSDDVYTMEENSIEVSLDNGATWTMVGPIFPRATAWQMINYDLSAYDGVSNVWIAFRHNDVGGWGQGLAVNDVCVSSSTGGPTSNAVVEAAPRLNAEYTVVPLSQETPALISAEIMNAGGSDLTNVVLISSLFEESDPVNPVAVLTSSAITIAPGATMVIDNNPSATTIGALGRYYVEHVVSHDNSANETDASNDTLVTPIFELSDGLYARNDTTSADQDGFGIGTGGGNNAIIGQNFELVASSTLVSVEVVIDGDPGNTPGEPVSVAVYACDANGIPQAPALDTTEVQMTVDGTIDETFILSFDTPLDLTTGTYFFGALEEGSGSVQVKGYSDIYTPGDNTQGTNWVTWDGNPDGAGVFTEPTTLVAGFAVAYHIRPILGAEACSAGSLAGGGAIASVCGSAATFNFATDGTEQIPSGGNYGWNFTPGPNAGGGVSAGFSITESVPNITWDADLGGILSDNALSPLTGTWIVTGFSYADENDIGGTLCGFTTGTFEITFSPDIVTTATVTDASSSGAADGAIDLTATGGIDPLTYTWSNGANTPDISGVASGDYTVTVTDAAGCESITVWTVDFVVGTEDIQGLQSLELYPNPADSRVFIQLDLENSMNVMLDVFSVTGQKLMSFPAERVNQRQYELDTKGFQAGIYLARFTIDGKVATKRFTIAR